MRKIYFLLLFVVSNFLLKAQSTPVVNFTFTVNAATSTVGFVNVSQSLGEGPKKAVWNFGDGAEAVTGPYEGTSHHYAAPGSYTVCLRVYRVENNSNILLKQECKAVVLQPQQACEAGFQWAPDGGAAYSKTIVFHGAGNSNPAKVMKEVCWNFGDGTNTCKTVSSVVPSATLLNVQHTYAQSGTYHACLRIVYDGGCVAEKCNEVIIAPAPAATCSADFTAKPTAASPLGRRFVAQPANSQQQKPVRICWKFGDGTPDVCKEYTAATTGDYYVEHTYARYGKYEACVVIKYDGGCESKKCNVVEVNPVPPPPATTCSVFLADVPPANTQSAERRYRVELMPNKIAKSICWDFGDGVRACTNLTNPVNQQDLTTVHHYTAPGLYRACVKVTYDGGCVAERCTETIIGGNVKPKLVLSPNPVVSTLTAVFQSTRQQEVSVKIFNSYGILLRQEVRSAVVGTNTWTFNAGLLPIGAYSMVVQSSNQFATAIFFKQ